MSSESTAEISFNFRSFIQDWPIWWRELSWKSRLAPAFWVALWWAALGALQGLGPDQFKFGVAILVLGYTGRGGRKLLEFLLPFILVLMIYDSMRFYSDYIRGPIHVDEPYHWEKALFGIKTAEGVLTPNEWWQKHTHPVLDFFTGLSYLIFFFVYVLNTAFFYFWIGRDPKLKPEIRKAPWAFFWVNTIGYSTYYWFAAAPPWYVEKYGLGPANMSARPSQAGCVRFDALFGTHFFSEMYGRSNDVFGAIPSLHVAYPLLGAFYALQFGRLRAFSIGFYLLMCFSAVYLNHHYIIDVIWGSAYATIVYFLLRKFDALSFPKKTATLT